jgi:hypothetical protein
MREIYARRARPANVAHEDGIFERQTGSAGAGDAPQ